MATRKQLQIASLIKRNFGTVLMEQGMNIYGNAFVTVTNVIMTPDMSLAKIYLSVYNTEDKKEVLDKIRSHRRHLKSHLVTRIRKHIRRMPEIDIYMDETIDEMYRVDSLFKKLRDEKQMGEEE